MSLPFVKNISPLVILIQAGHGLPSQPYPRLPLPTEANIGIMKLTKKTPSKINENKTKLHFPNFIRLFLFRINFI
jgi:hypothetical protein